MGDGEILIPSRIGCSVHSGQVSTSPQEAVTMMSLPSSSIPGHLKSALSASKVGTGVTSSPLMTLVSFSQNSTNRLGYVFESNNEQHVASLSQLSAKLHVPSSWQIVLTLVLPLRDLNP